MNYAKAQPNGPLTVADQIKFLRINAGTRLISAPDRPCDKLAGAMADHRRSEVRMLNVWKNRINLLHKGFSISTANNYRVKKNHRN